jgi:all-trans-retinol 13,14-reductase
MTGQPATTAKFDAILIGSGMGALTVASILARCRNQRVLVVEKHFQAGGFSHEFSRGPFHWNVGLHEVGDMNPGSVVRRIFDLIVDRQVDWTRVADPYDRFFYPELTFDFVSSAIRLQETLISQFPHEERGIRMYLKQVRRAALGYKALIFRRNGSRWLRGLDHLAEFIRPTDWQQTTSEVLNALFRDPALKSLLASHWCYYGLPPSLSPFPLHALVVDHYLNGAYYPKGGAGTIAKAVQDIVKSRNGQFLIGHAVKEILLKDGRAVGIRTCRNSQSSETAEYLAPVVVSDAGSATTYLDLIADTHAVPFRSELQQFVNQTPHLSHVAVYLGLTRNPSSLGFSATTCCFFEEPDHNTVWHQLQGGAFPFPPQIVFLTFPTLKSGEAAADTRHTGCMIAPMPYACFEPWKTQPWRRRDQQYQELKEALAQAMIGRVDRSFPGFREIVEYCEVSTPLTTENFTGHRFGAIYGLPCVATRFQESASAWTSPRSHIPGLYLTGADVFSPGIVGAMAGGIIALSHLPNGLSSFGMLSRALFGR